MKLARKLLTELPPRLPHSFHNLKGKSSLGIISAGFQKGQPKGGVELGPQAIKEQGLIKNLKALGYTTSEYPDLKFEIIENEQPDGKVNFPLSTGKANQQVSSAVYNSIVNDKNDKTLVLGGDHSIAIGSIYGHSKTVSDSVRNAEGKYESEDDFCCLWIDAHADINTSNTSYSGNLHGQVLSYLLDSDIIKKYVRMVRGFDWVERRSLRPERLAYIGLRDIDQMEAKLLHKLGITCCSMHDVDKYGINFCIEKSLDKINPSGSRSMHVSFDIDALDPDFAPSTGTPVPAGLTLRDAQYIGEKINRMGVKINVMDLVEVNPKLFDNFPDVDPVRTAKHANYVIESFMGRDRAGAFRPGLKLPTGEDF